MSDYTPTLEDAKRTYAYIQGGLDHDEGYKPFYQVHEEAFDRMIAEVERAAAARALDEAADGIESRRNEPGLVHLDVRYAGYYTGIRSGMESDSKALRARAEAYRQERGEQ